jgi:hypothetical protein
MDDCENGAAMHSPTPAGMPCEEGACDGAGRCVPACISYDFKPGFDIQAGSFNDNYVGAFGVAAITGAPEIVAIRATSSGATPAYLTVPVAEGDGAFKLATTPLHALPEHMAFGDYNQDGHLDVALVRGQGDEGKGLAVLLGNGQGTFAYAMETEIKGQDSARGVVSVDVDGDGILDLAIPTYRGVALLYGKGDGTFWDSELLGPDFTGCRGIVAADLDGDGRVDLASSCDQPILYRNIGGGNFTVAYLGPKLGLTDLTAADLNDDGAVDLAVATDDGVEAWLNNGHGTFSRSWKYTAPDGVWGRSRVALVDLNGDGRLDFTVTPSLTYPPTTASVFQGTGDGVFGAALLIDKPKLSHAIWADMNQDGRADLVAKNHDDDNGGPTTFAVRFNTCTP